MLFLRRSSHTTASYSHGLQWVCSVGVFPFGEEVALGGANNVNRVDDAGPGLLADVEDGKNDGWRHALVYYACVLQYFLLKSDAAE